MDTNLLFIHHGTRVSVTRMTMGKLLDLQSAHNFARVHKSYVAALRAIQKIERHQAKVEEVVALLARSYRGMLEEPLLARS
jgi:two-component system LytT family response regulator